MEIRYRRNTASDAEAITALLNECFGYTAMTGARARVDSYLLAFDGDQLIALTGILDYTDYNGYEVGWTCCKEGYRGLGIATTLLSMELMRIGNTEDVYCEAWSTNNIPHLKHALVNNGFVVQQEIGRRQQDRYKSCKMCAYRDESGSCRCSTILYKRFKKV